jgi:deoxyadenosine/deoxycytidine kinase
MSAALVSIIGPPAVGKTTLAELLCQDLPAQFIREDWEGNPFLPASYAGDASTRLPGQMYFLLSRVRQLAATTWPEEGTFVSDYGFCQDRIFARQRLGRDELADYDAVARRLGRVVQPASVLILLDAQPATLLARLAARARDFERVMDEEFLESMRSQYARASMEALCPVIDFDCDAKDFREPPVRAELVARIRKELGQGS